MNLYDLHNKPETLHRHADADTNVVSVFWGKYKNNPVELKKREDAIAKNAQFSLEYALYVLKGRFEKGEDVIAKDANYSYVYASDVLKRRRFEKGEDVIAKNAYYSYQYARDVLKGRFEKGEDVIAKNAHYNKLYKELIK